MAIAGLLAWLLYRETPNGTLLGFVMFLAMILNMLVAAAVGLAVPMVLRASGRDPAVGRLGAADVHHRFGRLLHLPWAGNPILSVAPLTYATLGRTRGDAAVARARLLRIRLTVNSSWIVSL